MADFYSSFDASKYPFDSVMCLDSTGARDASLERPITGALPERDKSLPSSLERLPLHEAVRHLKYACACFCGVTCIKHRYHWDGTPKPYPIHKTT